ncbi:6-carboxytetrahydropterin synthase [Streptomyces sp. BE20]|uniref:6-carboxytetrahydropterin synthase n=1 Tax=Streptomyces sp. BE20 TaxID=3002525 RepID=UPI002E782CA4|nr:6-carboxytetrahydropterin synthase [Streptomyces sp. BE20]MEE1820963.1 6-carboxytetrahydropterin synthase [Streptomyces sp. BE20]
MTHGQDLFRIGKTFSFEATRTLDGALDGRSFLAEVTLVADRLTGPGFVVDFGQLRPVKQYIDANLDHRLLDGVVDGTPTGEAIADHLLAWCREFLPPTVAARLETVSIRTGRRPAADATAVPFAASHRLGGLPEGHQCGRLHGHSYLVSPLPGAGQLFPVSIAQYIKRVLDGRLLNDVVDFEPTSELLARHLTGQAAGAVAGLRVSETESSWAEFRTGAR